MMNLILICIVHSLFNEENPAYVILFLKKKKCFNIGLYSDNYRLVSFKLGMMIETSKLYIFICLDDLDLHSRPHLTHLPPD